MSAELGATSYVALTWLEHRREMLGHMNGPLGETAAVSRLLHRTGFGATAEAVAAATKTGFAAAVGAIVVSDGTDPGAVATPVPSFPALHRPEKADRADQAAKRAFHVQARAQRETLALWWLDRMVAATLPWLEKRTLLWHGHWATSIVKVKSATAMALQNETERTLGGGDFRTFARAMVRDPALMIWLDASGNTAKAPNENLGRELMELFTLGFGHYQESDVRQAAKALTGWRVNRRADPPRVRFIPRRHVGGTETILGRTADFDDQSLVDLLVSQPASARYLATRLWGWLVAATPPGDATLDRMTTAYGADRDLTALFRAMLTDPAFRDPASIIVKQPIDYVVGVLRFLGLRPTTLDKKSQHALLTGLSGLGQVPFEPPSVGGWPSNGAWLTTSAAHARLALALNLARKADLTTIRAQPAKELPGYLAAGLGVGAWTSRTQSALVGSATDPVRTVALALASPEYIVSR